MSSGNFLQALNDVEFGTPLAAVDMNQVTLYSEFLAALDARIVALAIGSDQSPALRKWRAVRDRVLERQNETNPIGAGLVDTDTP